MNEPSSTRSARQGTTRTRRVTLHVTNGIPPNINEALHVLHCYARVTFDLYLVRIDTLSFEPRRRNHRSEPVLSDAERKLEWWRRPNVLTLQQPEPLYRVSFWRRRDASCVVVKDSELTEYDKVPRPEDFTVEPGDPPPPVGPLRPPEVLSLYQLAHLASRRR